MDDDNRRNGNTNNRKRKARRRLKPEIRERRKRRVKLYSMVFVFFICFIFLAYKIVFIKVVKGEEYEARAITQLINGSVGSEHELSPNRGSILDRDMNPIATSAKVYTIYVDPRKLLNDSRVVNKPIIDPVTGETKKGEFEEISHLENTIEKINEIIGIPIDELDEHLAIADIEYEDEEPKEGQEPKIKKVTPVNDNSHQVVMKEVPADKALLLEESNAAHVYLEAVSKRSYANNNLAASVIGFARGDSIMGMEKQYDKYLSGVPGRSFRVYTSEGEIQTNKIEAQDGDTVITTLDMTMQKFAEDAAEKYGEKFDAKSASVIIMDPNTGEVFAMSSYPSFNLNDPLNLEYVTKSKYRDEWKDLEGAELIEKFDTIWRNYNLTSTFEPGSIFKPVTVGAALESGIIDENSTFYCPGSKTVVAGQKPIGCDKRSGHGTITLKQAVAQSCNVAMMDIAEMMGRDIFYKYQKDFGYGEKTGIDLPAEVSASGLLHTVSALDPLELATSSFGQRFNTTTMQNITAFAATINGGNVMKPYVVSQVVDTSGNILLENTPTVVRKAISKETSDYLRITMESVISEGTGWRAKIDGWAIGGKTGTGEQGISGTDDYDHSLDFIGYFPVENPEYIVMVTLDHLDYTQGVTSPGEMLKEVIQNIIRYKNIPPSYDSDDLDSLYDGSSMITMGDYVGKTLEETTKELNSLSLGYELIGGSGTIISSQFPSPGVRTPKDTIVLLTIKNGDVEYEMTTVPDVTGLTEAQAKEMLEALKLGASTQIDIVEDATEEDDLQLQETEQPESVEVVADEEYIVYAQMPEPDKNVMIGTQVKIKLRKIDSEITVKQEEIIETIETDEEIE